MLQHMRHKWLSDLMGNPPPRAECWPYPGPLDRHGRARTSLPMELAVQYGDRHGMAHRITYTLMRGRIPDGLTAKFGNVFRLRSGRYGARYTRQGVLHRAPETFDTEEAARDWLRMQRAGV